jgi:hypothetical protein
MAVIAPADCAPIVFTCSSERVPCLYCVHCGAKDEAFIHNYYLERCFAK